MADIVQKDFSSGGLTDDDVESQRLALNAQAETETAATADVAPAESAGAKFLKTDIPAQIVGGMEDAFKNTVNGVFAVGEKVNSMLPLEQQLDALKDIPRLDPNESFVPHPDGGGMKFLRAASQFLIPFGAVSKGIRATAGLAGAANLAASTAATGFFALDPAEKNLSNMIQTVPELQNPVSEFLASDGSDTATSRMKNAIEQTMMLTLGDKIFEKAIVPVVKAGAKAVVPAANAAASGLGDLSATLTDAIKAIKDKRDLANQGFTNDSVKSLAQIKDVVNQDVSLADDLGANLSKAREQEQTEDILTGAIKPEEIKMSAEVPADTVTANAVNDSVGAEFNSADNAGVEVAANTVNTADAQVYGPSQFDDRVAKTTFGVGIPELGKMQVEDKFISQAAQVKDDLAQRVFGKTTAEFDTMKTLKSAGLVDDPVISDLLKFASEQTPKTHLTWDETNAKALGLSVDEAQKRFGTAGDFTAGIASVKNEAIARAAKLTELVNSKGLDNPESAEALAQFLQVSSVEKMMASESGRALNSLKQTRSVATVLQNIDTISKQQMTDAIKSFGGDADKLLQFGRQLGRSKIDDIKLAVHTFWVNSILSGPVTHMTNFVSNLTFLILRPVERLGAAGVGTLKSAVGVLNDSDRVLASEVLEMYHGIFQGTRDGWKSIIETGNPNRALRDTVGPEASTKFDQSAQMERGGMLLRKVVTGREENLTYEQFKQAGPLGMAQELLARALTVPTDTINGADQWFKTAAARGQKRALAFRSATQDGLVGDAFDGRMKAVMSNTPIDDPERVILNNINNAAAEFARETVFQKDLKFASALGDLRDKVPGMKYIIPFVKIPSNIIDETFLRRTPIGLASSRIRGEILAGGAKGDEAISRMVIGTSVAASIAAAYSSGSVTGAGPKNKDLRDKWLETHQPWSIKSGNQWYSYNKLEPIGSLMGLGARLAEVIDHNADVNVLSPDEEQELSFSVAGAFTKYMTDKSVMTGLENILSVMEGDEGAAKKFVADMAGGFVPYSAALRSVKNISDNELRDTDGILDKVSAQLPGLSEQLPNKRNRFGDIVTAPDRTTALVLPISHTPGGVNDDKTIKINQIENDAGISISKPDRIFQGIKLTLPEYDARLKALNEFEFNGVGVKDAIINTATRPEFQGLPSTQRGGQGALIKNIYGNYLRASDAKFLQQHPEINVRVERAKMDSFTVNRQINKSTGEPQAKPVFVGAE